MTGYLIDIAKKHPPLSDEVFVAAEAVLLERKPNWVKLFADHSGYLAQYVSLDKKGSIIESISSYANGAACHANIAAYGWDILAKKGAVAIAQPIFEGTGPYGTTKEEDTTMYLNWFVSDDNPFAWMLDPRCRSVEYIREKGAIFNVQGLACGPVVHMAKVLRVIHEAPYRISLFAKFVREGVGGRLAYVLSQGFSSDCTHVSTGNHESSFNVHCATMAGVRSYLNGETPKGFDTMATGNTMYGASHVSNPFSNWTKDAYEKAVKNGPKVEKEEKHVDAWGCYTPTPVALDPYAPAKSFSFKSVLYFAKKFEEEFYNTNKVAA